MAVLLSENSFLQTRARLLVLPLPASGIVKNTMLQRTLGMHKNVYDSYRQKARKGDLVLAEVLLHTVQKQATGLSAGSNVGADYVAVCITSDYEEDHVAIQTMRKLLQNLDDALKSLIRYENLRHIAVYTAHILPRLMLTPAALQSLNLASLKDNAKTQVGATYNTEVVKNADKIVATDVLETLFLHGLDTKLRIDLHI